MTELFPYQREGAIFLAERKRALLADDPGLGKSAQAIAAALAIGAESVLVICPASLRENWRREFRKFGAGHVNVEVLSFNQATDSVAGRGVTLRDKYEVLIVDEAHFLKSVSAKRTLAIYGKKLDLKGGIAERAEYVWLLSGTPAPNHPGEMFTHLTALYPSATPGLNHSLKFAQHVFTQRYCQTRQTPFGWAITGVRKDKIKILRERMRGFIMRRKKAEVMKDLPDKIISVLPMDPPRTLDTRDMLTEEQLAWVNAALDGGADGLAEISQQLATYRLRCGLIKAHMSVGFIEDFLEDNHGKIVVFAYHREVIAHLRDALSQKFGVAVVEGSTPAAKRQTEVDRFQNDAECRVFIGQIQAAGTGLTLTAASDLLFVEYSWVPSDNVQAADRIHRIGQKNSCLIRFASWAGSIDDKITEAVARKTEMLATLFE